MPLFSYLCSKCGMRFDHTCRISDRWTDKHCPGCNSLSSRDVESELHNSSQGIQDHPRESHAMGVNPEQIPEAMKNFPGSEYNPTNGALIIKNRQHKLYEMKRRGCEEHN